MDGNPPFSRKTIRREFITPTSAGLGANLRRAARKPVLRGRVFSILGTTTEVWLIAKISRSLLIGFRLICEPNGFSKITARLRRDAIEVRATGGLGRYRTHIQTSSDGLTTLHVITTLLAAAKVKRSNTPREICLMDARFEPLEEGLVYTHQTGATAGQAYVATKDARIFYFQNLNSIARYAQITGAKLEGSVGIEWPELGMSLPAGSEMIPAKRELVLSDTYLRVRPGPPGSEADSALSFLEDLHAVYLELSKPGIRWFDWQEMGAATLDDLSRSKHCHRAIRGTTFLNAYVGSTDKPPESMVQGAVLVPLLEYESWLGKPLPLLKKLDGTLPAFFNEELGCPLRWLPGCKFLKPIPSEEEAHGIVDSWYLFHTLMNLGRLAEMGREREREMFLASLPYAIRTAHHFDYEWPVFFYMETLRVHKRETERGRGGEQDAPGLYAHLMMQAWKLTREPVYLSEAEAAAERLNGLGFGVLYQTNNTMFGAVALAWLWKETGNARYKDLSFVSIGSILSHLWLWEPDMPERTWKTFMALPPLHDAPYIAAYEEAEVYASAVAYLDAMGKETPESITTLLVEYGRHLLDRARYYFPSSLGSEAVCTEPKEGRMEPSLSIPVEDLYSSDAKAGQVGQQVYGAALALILTTRSCHRWKEVPFQVWCNAPVFDAEYHAEQDDEGSLVVSIAGSPKCHYDLRLIPVPRSRRSLAFNATSAGSPRSALRTVANEEGHSLFHVRGEDSITIRWSAK